MAYDEKLAQRVRDVLGRRRGVTEKKMFGGLTFMLDGHMGCGVVGDRLMVRVGPEAYESALAEPHVEPMDFTGKPMKGMVYVGKAAVANEADVRAWVEQALRFVGTLGRR